MNEFLKSVVVNGIFHGGIVELSSRQGTEDQDREDRLTVW